VDYRRGCEGSAERKEEMIAAGPTGVTSDLLQTPGMVGLRELTNIMNDNIYGEKVPEDCKSSTTIPIYKGKGDAMECGKYRGVRLLGHGMKVYGYVLEKRIRDCHVRLTIRCTSIALIP